jgi:hypothetical protein
VVCVCVCVVCVCVWCVCGVCACVCVRATACPLHALIFFLTPQHLPPPSTYNREIMSFLRHCNTEKCGCDVILRKTQKNKSLQRIILLGKNTPNL